jgi:hypothetical protein
MITALIVFLIAFISLASWAAFEASRVWNTYEEENDEEIY